MSDLPDLFGRTTPSTVSLEQVNTLIKSANAGYETIIKTLNAVDANMLTDMEILFSKQDDTTKVLGTLTDAVTALHTKSAPVVKVVKMPRLKVAVIMGAGIYIGYQLAKPAQPKKEN